MSRTHPNQSEIRPSRTPRMRLSLSRAVRTNPNQSEIRIRLSLSRAGTHQSPSAIPPSRRPRMRLRLSRAGMHQSPSATRPSRSLRMHLSLSRAGTHLSPGATRPSRTWRMHLRRSRVRTHPSRQRALLETPPAASSTCSGKWSRRSAAPPERSRLGLTRLRARASRLQCRRTWVRRCARPGTRSVPSPTSSPHPHRARLASSARMLATKARTASSTTATTAPLVGVGASLPPIGPPSGVATRAARSSATPKS
mmetsp:Transcript_136616/g.437057  ORF Transcript_136616/g.437057 Transcript_136616/m.437057 type:complete len:253 (+) Transcript_136616:156-914(+)